MFPESKSAEWLHQRHMKRVANVCKLWVRRRDIKTGVDAKAVLLTLGNVTRNRHNLEPVGHCFGCQLCVNLRGLQYIITGSLWQLIDVAQQLAFLRNIVFVKLVCSSSFWAVSLQNIGGVDKRFIVEHIEVVCQLVHARSAVIQIEVTADMHRQTQHLAPPPILVPFTRHRLFSPFARIALLVFFPRNLVVRVIVSLSQVLCQAINLRN
mmetsp:Transcript_71474/g.113684  ORF Transcript_71474/g.113684 Transcript_71474/m.113684 type:complete len:209 (+) Transcript_71474:389-1015(+)